jgi:anti-sigma B factor antagonist
MLTHTDIHQDENGIAVVKFSGRFTLGSSMSLAQSKIDQLIDQDGVRKLVFDLAEVEHIDSAGLGMIVYTRGKLHQLDGKLRLAAPNERVRQMFKMTHTDDLLDIDPDALSSIEKLKD